VKGPTFKYHIAIYKRLGKK